MLYELYEVFYGIYDHINKTHPFQGVLFHDAEQTVPQGPFNKAATRFIYAEVYKKTGLNLDEFLNLERWEIEQLYTILGEYDEQGHKVMKKELESQRDLLSPSKKPGSSGKLTDDME